MDSKLPIKYYSLDPVRRPGDPLTVSYACPRCSTPRTTVRNTHGAPGCQGKLGEIIGSRGIHCDTSGGDVLLVLGPEQYVPVKGRRTRQPKYALAGAYVDAELTALFT